MKKTLNIRSNQLDNNGLPKSPTESQLLYGEIAINYKKSKETLFIKNDENEIIPFSNDNTIISLIEENSVKESSGVSISQDNDISVKLGEHLEFDENSAITLTIDDNLDSGSTNPIANSAVTQAIFDNEEVVAAALNDLKETKQDTLTAGNGISISNNVVSYTGESQSLSAGSGVNVSNGVINVKLGENLDFDSNSALTLIIDDELDSGSTNPVSNSAVTTAILDNEFVVSNALNELRIQKQNVLTAGNGISISNDTISYTGESQNITAGSGLSLNNDVLNIKLGSGISFDSNSALTVESASIDIDSELNENSSNPVANSAITQAINGKQDELIASSGITIDANDNISVKLGECLEFDENSGITLIVDDELDSGSTNPIANSAITQAILDNEEVVAAALNDLKETKQDTLTAGSGISISNNVVSYTGQSQSLTAGSGINITNDAINIKLGSGISFDANSALTVETVSITIDPNLDVNSPNPAANSAITQAINEKQDEIVASSGITIDANDNISVKLGEYLDFDENSGITLIIDDELDSGSTNPISNSAITKVIYDNELVISSALNDLNDRENSSERNIEALNTLVNTKQETLVSGTNIKTINGNSILGSGDLVIEGGGSGGDTNVIETVKVNGTPLTPDANKAVDVTVPTALSGLTDDATHRLVTDTEKNTWNGKQDALANANILSGITSTNVINWNSAASNSHTHSNKSVLDNLTQSVIDNSHTHANKTVLDGISSTDISNWNSKTDNVGTITGINMNGASKGTSGVVDLGTVITSETQLTKGTTTGTGNAVTDISVSDHQITLTKGSTFLTEHQSLKTLNGTPLGGTGNISLTGVPTFDPVADEGKILGIVNGALAWVSPITIYTGNGTPSDSQGKDGDIYLQTS